MASTADPSSTSRSPRAAHPSRGPSSPWSHVLRGDPESAASAAFPAPPSSSPPPVAPILSLEPSDRSPPVPHENVASSSGTAPQSSMPSDTSEHGSNGNAAASASSSSAAAARGKKPAWQRPSNGWIEVDPVMGASWPPLSLSTKASPKPSSSDTSKGSSDITISAPPGPVISTPSPKPNSNNINLNSTPDLVVPPARQKPNKRGNGGGSSSGTPTNSIPALQSLPPASAAATQITPAKQNTQEPSPRDLPNKNSSCSNWEHGTGGGGFGPQQHGGNDHHRGYGGNRRGGGGASHHGSFGSRRDQDRGNHEWSHRGFSSRDASMQQHQQRGVRLYHRPPPLVAPPPFMGPPTQVRPFVNPIGYPDIPPPVYLPFVAHPAATPAMFYPPIDPQRATLLKQINYYFSTENLCKDIYLRQNMDEQGWVPISLIAGFNRVKQLTNSKQYILDTVWLSDVVEVQGEKIRRRNDWMNWVLPPSPNHFGTVSGMQSPATSDYDTLVAQLQTVGLEGTSNHNSMGGSTHISRSASGRLNNQFQVAGGLSEDGKVTGYRTSDYSKPGRSLVRSDTL